MFKNVAGQRWVVFAFEDGGGTTPGAPKTGDAANITAKIAKDGAAAGATNDVNPTELEDGYYAFDLTQAETNADDLLLLPESATANIVVVGVPGQIFTRPANFGDMGIETDGHVHSDLKEMLGVAQSVTDLKDFADAGYDPATNKVEGVKLVDTTTTNTDMRGTDSAALASVATEARLAELDAANLPADVDTLLTRITSTLFSGITSLAEWLGALAGKQTADATARTEIRATGAGSGTFDETTDSQEAVRDTAPLGTAMRGTDSAALASVATEARLAELDAANLPADVDTLLSRITSTLFSGITALAEWLGALAGKQAADATAQTEIRATGAGSGTYDPTTDSQEAIRDTAPLGTAMRGTDSAALASVVTEARLAELDAANMPSDLDAVLVDTNELQGDWTDGGRLDLLLDRLITEIDTARAEPGQGAPAASAKIGAKIDYLYKAWRNKSEQTATQHSLYDDAGTTVDQKRTVSDDGTTFTAEEVASGP